MTDIWRNTFEHCSSLQNIQIPNSVTSIKEYAFLGCFSLQRIHIPNSVTIIWRDAFLGCSASFDVDVNNPHYTSIDRALYSKDRKKLIKGNTKKDFIIPYGVTSIGDCAFYRYSSLQSIHLPDSVTCIEDYAFPSVPPYKVSIFLTV